MGPVIPVDILGAFWSDRWIGSIQLSNDVSRNPPEMTILRRLSPGSWMGTSRHIWKPWKSPRMKVHSYRFLQQVGMSEPTKILPWKTTGFRPKPSKKVGLGISEPSTVPNQSTSNLIIPIERKTNLFAGWFPQKSVQNSINANFRKKTSTNWTHTPP